MTIDNKIWQIYSSEKASVFTARA